MSEVINNNCIIFRLQNMLNIYDRILLVQEKEEFRKCLACGRKTDDSNFLLLIPDVFKEYFEEFGFSQKFLTQEEVEELIGLYFTYEFSNRFRIISKDGICGNIFQLVENGLLTYEEALEAILR